MPSSSSALLLVMALVALPVRGASQTAPATAQAPAQAAAPAKPAAPKATTTATTKSKRGAKSTASSKTAAAGKSAKSLKGADCDTPVPEVAVAAPVPVAADPLAATLAPCTDSKPKP